MKHKSQNYYTGKLVTTRLRKHSYLLKNSYNNMQY